MRWCPQHGQHYIASGGYGRCKFTFCFMCRTTRVAEKLDPGAGAEANSFLKAHAEDLKPEKTTSVSTIRVADCNINKGRSEDERLGRNQRVTAAIEDEFLSAFGDLAELQDTDRLRDAVAGIMQGSVRAAASKYGLHRDAVFRVRLMIEMNGLEAGVRMLLKHLEIKRVEAAIRLRSRPQSGQAETDKNSLVA